MTVMRRILIATALAVMVTACGSYGGSVPAGGYSTDAPKAAPAGTPNGTPPPTGDPYVDNYGY